MAVCQQFDVGLQEILDTKPRLIALLSQIRDPGNAGTVLRAADAAGADAELFTNGSVDIYNPKVVRSVLGQPRYDGLLQRRQGLDLESDGCR